MKTHKDGDIPINDGRSIFVFGSNLNGIHGAGAAKYARYNCGAKIGQGVGRMGRCYAIPTKGHRNADGSFPILTLDEISQHVVDFLGYAHSHAGYVYYLTRIGCGLAGYKDKDIAPMFKGLPHNSDIPEDWARFLLTPSKTLVLP